MQHIDVPALYNPDGRYRYWNGINWRALLALLIAVSPNLPGLGYSIGLQTNPITNVQIDSVNISSGAKHLYTFDWLFGFVTSIVVYTSLSYIFPHKASKIVTTIYGHEVDEGTPSDVESSGVQGEKGVHKDFGNVDAVDFERDHHGHGHGKHHEHEHEKEAMKDSSVMG
jgi:NCS1 family nucleobase:cation symporter-1